MGLDGAKSRLTGKPSYLIGEEVTGRLEAEKGRYFIVADDGRRIPVTEGNYLLADPEWPVTMRGDESNMRILERFSGQDVLWYGQINERLGFIPYTAVVEKPDGTKRFFYSITMKIPSEIASESLGVSMPIQIE